MKSLRTSLPSSRAATASRSSAVVRATKIPTEASRAVNWIFFGICVVDTTSAWLGDVEASRRGPAATDEATAGGRCPLGSIDPSRGRRRGQNMPTHFDVFDDDVEFLLNRSIVAGAAPPRPSAPTPEPADPPPSRSHSPPSHPAVHEPRPHRRARLCQGRVGRVGLGWRHPAALICAEEAYGGHRGERCVRLRDAQVG